MTINRDDTSIDLIQHVPSGETYVARFASTEEDGRAGATIITIVGPLYYRDWRAADGKPRADWIEWATDTLAGAGPEDDAGVEWANGERWQSIASSV